MWFVSCDDTLCLPAIFIFHYLYPLPEQSNTFIIISRFSDTETEIRYLLSSHVFSYDMPHTEIWYLYEYLFKSLTVYFVVAHHADTNLQSETQFSLTWSVRYLSLQMSRLTDQNHYLLWVCSSLLFQLLS